MVAENSAGADDQIIDLTELIEKGTTVHSSPTVNEQPPAQTNNGVSSDSSIEQQLASLNESKTAIDGDIEDILAQMDMEENVGSDEPVQADTASPQSPQVPQSSVPVADRLVNPHEELEMPGMGEVDDLLSSLNIPPPAGNTMQAGTGQADKNVPPVAPATSPAAGVDDLDALLSMAEPAATPTAPI